MDGTLKRRLRDVSHRDSFDSTSRVTSSVSRTREQARQTLVEASTRDKAVELKTNQSPRYAANPDGNHGQEEIPQASVDLYEQSPLYIDDAQLLKLRGRPPVHFVVQNASAKEEQVQSAATTSMAKVEGGTKTQSWHSPVHVPLAHRKLLQPPAIFREDPPFRPIAPRPPANAGSGRRKTDAMPQKVSKLSPMPTPATEVREQLANRAFVQSLRERNEELFERLVHRFSMLRRVSQTTGAGSPGENNRTEAVDFGVEDAILLFLDGKHKHDVLYFKRRNTRGVKPEETGKTLALSSAPVSAGIYLPYDLERIEEMPRPGAGDFFTMTNASIVQHSNNDSDSSGEAIPLSQWIMESKMFSLLLAGIPLFQKFLVRKVFVGWIRAIRQTIYRDNLKTIKQTLPFARQALAAPMLESCHALRDIQEIRSLSLPTNHPAMDLAAVQEHQKVLLGTAETKLIDAKEKLLDLMEKMVQSISDDMDPPTGLDELYSAEAFTIRTINAKWKSAPIAAIRQRKTDIHHQKTTAAQDMELVETYIRLMGYMFIESLYVMIIGCVQHLRQELCAEDNSGAICAAVTIIEDTLQLSPSLDQTKHVFLGGLARLIRLVSNFHFAKNAITWSNNRGTGALTLVAEAFASSESFSTEFDLQSVLRTDPTFDQVTKALIRELALWFNRAAQQMLSFESLRQVYTEVQSVRDHRVHGDGTTLTVNAHAHPHSDLSRITRIPGGELSRFLKSIGHRLNILDRSQHACQKLQSSWKVGFLEIQCRKSISEILELIYHERLLIHQNLYRLSVDGVTECANSLQRAIAVLEDRPQLIEFFCEQMKQVRSLKDGERHLNLSIRNVDEAVRTLKKFAPPLGSEIVPQYNGMHQSLNKYTTLSQSHAKFAAKVLPNITYQVNSALQKYSLRCHKLLRMYDDFFDMEEEEDMEKNVGTFQEIVRELAGIEKATKLYQEYQKMVGLKVVDIPALAEAMAKWGEVQGLVTFTLQWLETMNSMENGIFREQNWEAHAAKVHSYLPVIRELQSRGQAGFAEKMLENIQQSVIDYLRKLSLVKEMAQPWVKPHHWKEILNLMEILNYVSSIGVLITDGSTVTLGFLRSRDLWKYEMQIREITRKAHHDAVTERKLHAMKARLQDATLPILRIQDSYDLDLPRACQLLESFEDDLLTIQLLAQETASGALQLQLVQWRDEVHHCEEVLDRWSAVQRSRTQLSMLFALRDAQNCVPEASFEFQAIDRKWKAMMYAAKGTPSLSICLHEVVTVGFLTGAENSYAKLWQQLGVYLDDKRRSFPRFYFLSDHDLFQLLIYARDPKHLPQMLSTCFREVDSLRLVPARRSAIVTSEAMTNSPPNSFAVNADSAEGQPQEDSFRREGPSLMYSNQHNCVDIEAIYGVAAGEELPIVPLRVQASPDIWMKEFEERMRFAMINAVSSAMDGSLVALFEDNLDSLAKPSATALEKRHVSKSVPDNEPSSAEADAKIGEKNDRQWKDYPLQVVMLCMNILITHEISPLVRLDRSGAAWQRFWHLFQQKKGNLIGLIIRQKTSSRERWIASSMLTLLLNQSQGIHDLYEDQPLTVLSQSIGVATSHPTSDVSVYPYSYAAGDAFSWTKLPRFYYDPFEKRVTVHHLIKTFQYEYSFFGNYSCPVLSPLCERTLVAMSTALSLEHGVLMHSSSSSGCTRKRTLLRELSAMAGRECVPIDYSNGMTLTYLKRVLRGIVQSPSLWLSVSGLEMSDMVRIFAQEVNQIIDALRGHQGSVVVDGAPIDILNDELAIIVTCSLNYECPAHQQTFLCLTSSFVPVSCSSLSPEVLVEAILLVNGYKDGRSLSQRLEALFGLLINDPEPFAKDLALTRLLLALAIVRNLTSRVSTSWQSTEKCLVTAIWEEVYSKILPERRVAFLRCIRTIFPHAADLEINGFGMLALRAALPAAKCDGDEESSNVENTTEGYDSDEGEQYDELKLVKRKIENAILARQLSVSEFYVRKVLELYQIVSKRLVTVVVGHGVCGKSTTTSILSEVLVSDTGPSESENENLSSKNHIRTVRLYPEAFDLKDIYGQVTSDSTWDDGFFSHFFRQNGVKAAMNDSSFNYATDSSSSIESDLPSSSQLPRQGSVPFVDKTGGMSTHALVPASWIVFDGVKDASMLLEPLRGLMDTPPKDVKKMVLPNGDQLWCVHESLRIFCEVESLQQWSPAYLSRCGIVYMQTEMLPYTLLIKSWLCQQQPKRKRNSLVHLTKAFEPTSEFVAKLMRSHLPAVLDVCKRQAVTFLEFSVTHAVANMLQVLTPFVAEVAKGVVEETSEWMDDARIIVAYAATMSLGMSLHPRSRADFHQIAIQIAPQLVHKNPIFSCDLSATLFDVGIRFRDHRAVLFLWSRVLVDISRPVATRRSSFAYQAEFPRRTSAILKARGRIVTSDDTDDAEGPEEEVVGDTSSITSPLSAVYVPTAYTVCCNAWFKMVGLAKANAFIVGESGVGKTLVVENALRDLGQHERVSATALQLGRSTTGLDIQRAIENGMTGKLKGAQCPGVGKRALVLLLENLNLETQEPTISSFHPSSAMIRQVTDGRGSFIKSTKEFVEFKDLAVWCSYSMSAFGYPRVLSRLLRHFHVIWIPDQSDQVFAQVVPMFTTHFRSRYEDTFGDLTKVVRRLYQFPIDLFKRARKTWKPSIVSRHLIFNINTVLSILISLMNVSTTRIPADPTVEFERLSIYFTLQLFRNRLFEDSDRKLLESTALRIAKKLNFTSQSLAYLKSPGECLYADCGETDGITQVEARDLTSMFVAGEERFHWNYRATLKMNSTSSELTSTELQHPAQIETSPRKGMKSIRHLLGNTQGGIVNSTASLQESGTMRRSSLALVALKNGLPEEKVTADPSLSQLQNTVDIYSFLQSGVRHLLLNGSDTADRRSTTMVASGTLSFQFREVSTLLRLDEFIEQLKAVVLEAGLKATQTVIYAEFDDLNAEEAALLLYLIRQDNIPPHMYSSADKVKLYASDHQSKGSRSVPPPPSKFSFLQEITPQVKGNKSTKRQVGNLSAQSLAIFRENVRRSLYVVLSIGCRNKLLEFMTLHPSVSYRFVVKSFAPWEEISAEAVCESALQDWTVLHDIPALVDSPPGVVQCVEDSEVRFKLRDIMIVVHRTAQTIVNEDNTNTLVFSPTNRGRRFAAVTTHLDNMLRVFKVLFAFHQKKLQSQLRDLRKALEFLAVKLSQTNLRVSKEETSEILHSDATQAVSDSSTELAEQETVEKEARRLFLLDEGRCVKIQTEIEVERASIQRELSKTLPDVQEATEALSQINKYHIVEMKSFTNPPQLVRLVMQAVCVLLGVPPTWSEALRILADIRFLERLRDFDKDHIDSMLMERVKFYVNHPDFSMENMRRASLASTTLCKWVLALVRYFDAMKRVAPTKQLLEETERQFHIVEERLQEEKRKLVDIEVHLAGLRIRHTQNLQREAELQRTQETRMRWKSSVEKFADIIQQWYDITRERLETVEQQLKTLLGDCVIVATLVVFGAELRHDVRENLVLRCREAIQRHFGAPPNEPYPVGTDTCSILQHWAFSEEGLTVYLRKVIIDMEDVGNEAFATSLFLMDQVQQICLKIPFLVDPLDRGVSWVKQIYRSMAANALALKGLTRPLVDNGDRQRSRDEAGAVVILDAGEPNMVRAIEACLAQSPPSMILIENASEGDESMIEAALELIVLLKEKSTCAVYFATKSLDKAALWTPKTWSHFAVIDFTPTERDLDNHLLTVFCHSCSSNVPVQNDIEAVTLRMSTEKSKEEVLFRSFVTSLCAASDEAARDPNSGVSATAASMLSTWVSSGTGPQGFYDEESMDRISAQLYDFLVVRGARKRMQQELQHLHQMRLQTIRFASQARAFITVEQGIAKLDASLSLPLVQVLADVSECLLQSLPSPQPNHEIESTSGNDQYNFVSQQPSSALRTLAESCTSKCTVSYLHRRLAGLPTWLHRTYLLALALAMTEMKNRDIKLTSGRLDQEQILRMCSQRTLGCQRPGKSSRDRDAVVMKTAHGFVEQVIGAGLLAAVGNLRRSCGYLDDELSAAFLKIQHGLSQIRDTSAHSALQQALYEDMAEHGAQWRAYIRSVSGNGARASDTPRPRKYSSVACLSAIKKDGVQWPTWMKQHLRLLEQLQVHLSLFGSISLSIIDDMIVGHLGEDVVSGLLDASEVGEGLVRPSLDGMVKRATYSTPMLILSDVREHAVAASSSVHRCARRRGIPVEAVAFMSIGQHTCVQGISELWSYRDKTVANSYTDSVARDAAAMTRLKEISMDAGWTIIENAVSSPCLSITNTLRLQIARVSDVKSTNREFRLWLVEGLANDAGGRSIARILTQRLFLEAPQTLRQHYDFHLQEERERREAEKLKKKPGGEQQQEAALIQLPPLQRDASTMLTALQRRSSEQRQIRSALWLFHSVFRLHLLDSRSVSASGSPDPLPLDLYASHFEMDRVIRLIQLHLHQRVVASTVTAGVASSLVQLSAPSAAAAAEAQGKTLTELASLIYMGRQWSDVRAAQCRELLSWCLHYDTIEVRSSEQDASLMSKVSHLREKLVNDAMAPRTHLFDRVELDLLPTCLQYQHRTSEMAIALKGIATIYNKPSLAPQCARVDALGSTVSATCLQAAQRSLEQLIAKFPDKTSLSSGIEKLQKRQRQSMVVGWGKRKATFADLALIHSRQQTSNKVPGSAFGRQEYLPPHLQQQPAAHLTEVELPAMEAYLSYVWSSAEAILSLHASSTELLKSDVVATIKALNRGDLPGTWKGIGIGECHSEGHATPTRLESWLEWFRLAVTFYHAHQRSVMASTTMITAAIWLPALQRPKALFSSFCHSIAVRSGLPSKAISLSVIPSQPQLKVSSANAPTPLGPDDLLGSMTVSGLFLSNADWSGDANALMEQVHSPMDFRRPSNSTRLQRFQALPTLQLHATSRFHIAPTGLLLSGLGDENPHPTQNQSPNPSGFYRCPLYASPDHLAMLETPLVYVYLPVQSEHTASVMAVQGAALFLLEQYFD